MKIGITGGHLTPALGFIDWVKRNHPETELVYFGRVYSQTSLKQLAVEKEEVAKRKIAFIQFEGVRITGNIFEKAVGCFNFFFSLIHALWVLVFSHPSVLLSFGSYQAVPLVIAARLLRIPVVAHEGTSVLSKANRLIFRLAKRIAYSYDSLLQQDLNRYQVPIVKTGTPLRSQITDQIRHAPPAWLTDSSDELNILLVLGGNQGSLAINNLIAKTLANLTQRWTVVHQCGRDNLHNHYVDEMTQIAINAHIDSRCYYPRAWISEEELGWLYQHASACIARAGANTIEEIIFNMLPTVFIPLPFAHFQEQYLNATHLLNQGASLLLVQSEANSHTLLSALDQLMADRQSILAQLAKLKAKQTLDSAQKIYELVTSTRQ